MLKPDKLTPVEHELMRILWTLGEGTVHDILAQLPSKRALAYTSVSTILRILQQKHILIVRKEGRKHIYKPKLSKEVFAEKSVAKLLKQVFAGDSIALVNHLLDKDKLSAKEIAAIQQLLNEKKKELKC
jgi:predicted transcriptional regulator